MIIDYDHNPKASYEQKLQSLKESVQMALNEVGSGGTTDYNNLANKPQIEGVVLSGNKTFPNLNLNVLTNTEIQEIFDNLI